MALEESVLRSSFIVLPRSSPDGPWIIHPPIQDQAPKALEELPPIQDQEPRRPLKKAPSFIIRSSKIKPQRPFGSTTSTNPHSHRSSRSSPKALEDSFITVIQD
ncbi:hypothetical protein TB1_033694 [Malus domestica]